MEKKQEIQRVELAINREDYEKLEQFKTANNLNDNQEFLNYIVSGKFLLEYGHIYEYTEISETRLSEYANVIKRNGRYYAYNDEFFKETVLLKNSDGTQFIEFRNISFGPGK